MRGCVTRKSGVGIKDRPYADDIIDGEIRIYGPVHVTCVDAYTGLVLRKVAKDYVPWHEGGRLPPLEKSAEVSAAGFITADGRYAVEKGVLVRRDAAGKTDDGSKLSEKQPRAAYPGFAVNVLLGTRKNPLTGNEEKRIISKGAGCAPRGRLGIEPFGHHVALLMRPTTTSRSKAGPSRWLPSGPAADPILFPPTAF